MDAYQNRNVNDYWKYKKEQIKAKYEFLSEEDLILNEGKESEMIENLAYKLGMSKVDFINVLEHL